MQCNQTISSYAPFFFGGMMLTSRVYNNNIPACDIIGPYCTRDVASDDCALLSLESVILKANVNEVLFLYSSGELLLYTYSSKYLPIIYISTIYCKHN